jgi:hypothetical protein
MQSVCDSPRGLLSKPMAGTLVTYLLTDLVLAVCEYARTDERKDPLIRISHGIIVF